MNSYTTITTSPIHQAAKIVWYILDLAEILLLFRFLLKLLGANPNASFTSFIYQTTYSFAYPFLSVFRSTPVDRAGVFEWNSLLAMLVYYIVAVVIIRLFFMERTLSTRETAVRHY